MRWVYPTSTIWLHYADVLYLSGPMPINGNPYDADCAIALSFWRNSIPNHRLADVRNFYEAFKHNDEETMDHISHPYFSGFDPGEPNYEIAIKCRQIVEWYYGSCIPLIVQWEIAMSLCQQQGEAWVKNRYAHRELFCLWPPVGRSAYRTIDVLEDVFTITQEYGWKRPLLLAHDYHMPRVAMLARHFWPEFIIGFSTITRKFDPKSVQPSCASARQWYRYEAKARVHHLLHGWCFGHFTSGRF